MEQHVQHRMAGRDGTMSERYTKAKVEPTTETRRKGIRHPEIQTLYRIWYYSTDTGYFHYNEWWCGSDDEAADTAASELKRKNAILDVEDERKARIREVNA